MQTDNFERIKRLLDFASDDDFYLMQLIVRKKDNENIERNFSVIKTYYIRSVDNIDNKAEEVKFLCKYFNARAYINLNVKSFRKTTLMIMKEFAQRIMDENYAQPYKIFDSIAAQCVASRNKSWIVDIDCQDGVDDRKINEIVNFIDRECLPEGIKFVACIPTKNGKHIITKPFDLKRFKEDYPDIDVHKNNPTVLYCP